MLCIKPWNCMPLRLLFLNDASTKYMAFPNLSNFTRLVYALLLMQEWFAFPIFQVQAVTVHATNNYFVTASLDGSWCFYELSSGTCLTQVWSLVFAVIPAIKGKELCMHMKLFLVVYFSFARMWKLSVYSTSKVLWDGLVEVSEESGYIFF